MPVSRFLLRLFQPSDFEALLAMDQLCFPKSIAYGKREMTAYLQSPDSHCIVAESSGTIAGFILTERAGDLAHIVTLDVLEKYRRQSAGSLLLRAAEEEAASQGCTCIYLETATTNKPAIALWNKHGYREVDKVKNYYGRGQDAFEMAKRLEPKTQSKVQP